jgi:hypothetical protein
MPASFISCVAAGQMRVRLGYASLTDARQQLLRYALVSVEPIAKEAIQMIPADQIEAFSVLLGQLAGINLSNA